MSDRLTREDIEAIRHFAQEPCECPQVVRLIADEVPSVLCGPCKARRWLEEGAKLAEELG